MKQTKLVTAIRYLFQPLRAIMWYKYKGAENLPKNGGYIICCNHISMMDPILLLMATKNRIHFMGKEELFKKKIPAKFFKAVDVFAVSRGTGDLSSINTAIDFVKNGETLGIFPEGTRSKTGKPGRAKSGAAYIANATKADIVPVCIINKGTGKFKFFNRITIQVGKPIPYSEYGFEDTDRGGLRKATSLIMNTINELWENGQNEF